MSIPQMPACPEVLRRVQAIPRHLLLEQILFQAPRVRHIRQLREFRKHRQRKQKKLPPRRQILEEAREGAEVRERQRSNALTIGFARNGIQIHAPQAKFKTSSASTRELAMEIRACRTRKEAALTIRQDLCLTYTQKSRFQKNK